jgi:hypothetical protein
MGSFWWIVFFPPLYWGGEGASNPKIGHTQETYDGCNKNFRIQQNTSSDAITPVSPFLFISLPHYHAVNIV